MVLHTNDVWVCKCMLVWCGAICNVIDDGMQPCGTTSATSRWTGVSLRLVVLVVRRIRGLWDHDRIEGPN